MTRRQGCVFAQLQQVGPTKLESNAAGERSDKQESRESSVRLWDAGGFPERSTQPMVGSRAGDRRTRTKNPIQGNRVGEGSTSPQNSVGPENAAPGVGRTLLACFQPQRTVAVFHHGTQPQICIRLYTAAWLPPRESFLPGEKTRRNAVFREEDRVAFGLGRGVLTTVSRSGESAPVSSPVRSGRPGWSAEPDGRPAAQPAGAGRRPEPEPHPVRRLRRAPAGEPRRPEPHRREQTAARSSTAGHRWCSSSSGSSRHRGRRGDAA